MIRRPRGEGRGETGDRRGEMGRLQMRGRVRGCERRGEGKRVIKERGQMGILEVRGKERDEKKGEAWG